MTEVFSRWGTNASDGPIAELLQLRAYGKKIAMNTLARGIVDWSDNGNTLHCKYVSLDISALISMIDSEPQSAQAMMASLCNVRHYVHVQDIQLHRLVDTLEERMPDHWFSLDPRNLHFAELKRRIWTTIVQSETSRNLMAEVQRILLLWQNASLKNYLNKERRLLEKLLLRIHLCSGMLAHDTDILSIWFKYTISMRNLFIHDHQVMTNIIHNKRESM